MEIVDAQAHIWEPEGDRRPWDANFGPAGGPVYAAARKLLPSEAAVTDAMLIEAMDAVGVAGALLVATSHYGFDNSYSLEAAARHPDRFRVIGRIDPVAPDVRKHVAKWKREPYGAGLRVVVLSDADRDSLRSGRFASLFEAAQANRVPLCFVLIDSLPDMYGVAASYPDLQIVIDHLGLPRPPRVTREILWGEAFPQLLGLAKYPNVALKMTATPALSAEQFPFRDLWPYLRSLVEAYGPNRLMWGSDWTAHREWPYKEQVEFICSQGSFSPEDRHWIAGASLRTIFGWPSDA